MAEATTTATPGRFPQIKAGQVVRVHQKIKELNSKGEEKERIQVFEGTVLSRRGSRGPNATITVRKVSDGIGVERIFPLELPTIADIEVVKAYRTRRAKLYFMRRYGKKLREVAAATT